MENGHSIRDTLKTGDEIVWNYWKINKDADRRAGRKRTNRIGWNVWIILGQQNFWEADYWRNQKKSREKYHFIRLKI